MSELTAINDLMEQYFTFLHTGDLELLDDLFLPECQLVCPDQKGGVIRLNLEEYRRRISSRPSPKSLDFPRYGCVLHIDIGAAHMAVSKVSCAVQPNFFTDYLTLLKIDGDKHMVV